ncbi:Carboxypeptidase regulatory-like domain-containing protein [Bryocella elongata]|uniref:Carboxypeptidase regulatory-like domain-containing protein n=1 Tax=Bryocella elongata TaxID=863522 RepID=A0A1H5TSA9_9BACT|nr:carboxypeptidase regulatory-like domain-containing protein [Bryocella elongata]SEF65108.1 Carboxypeptidase regulatory-like domain-containing protein [Bryocella elongata]
MRKLIFLLLFSCVMSSSAQTDRATVTGTIEDSMGARVPGASVVVSAADTAIAHQTATSGAGVYTISALRVGNYTAEITAKGFEPIHVEAFQLNVGQTLILNVTLRPESVSTQVEVISADTGLDKNSAALGIVVQGGQIRSVPLNGRNWVSLMTITPGVIDSGTGSQDQMRFVGLSDEDNVYHLDGVDMSGVNHSYQKVTIRLQPSTEALAEFRANAAVYSADQGGEPGGQMELVSRSGGDRFHGAMWEFIRNSVFDAAPWGAATGLPALHLNNFGANLGGPAWRSRKMFFFVNWESLRQDINQPINGYVPSASYRAAVLATSPQLAPIVNAFPTSTVTTSNASENIWYGNGKNTQTEDSGLARFDYQVDAKTALSVRYMTDHFVNTAPYSAGNGYLTDTGFTTLTTPNVVVDLQRTFSPRLLNDFKFGVNRAAFTQGQSTALPIAVSVSGLSAFGNPSGSVRFDNSFNTVDDLTYTKGRHTLKAGVYIRRIQENKSSPNTFNQTISFTSLQSFQNDLIDSDSYKGSVPLTGQRMTEYFGYILDQYQMRPNLMWNVGLRYEYFGVDHEVLGRGVLVDPLTCPTVTCPAGTQWYSPNLLDFSPRISVTWSPTALHGKTVVRSGFGIYDGNGQFGNLGQPVGNITAASYTLTQQQAPGLSYPLGTYTGAISESYSPAASPRNRKDLQIDEWTLSVQHEVLPRTQVTLTYIGDSQSHAFSDWTLNGINPNTNTRPYAGYSTLDYRGSFNHATYHALDATIQRNIHPGLFVEANYQWSHSIDGGGVGGGEADIPQNFNCLRCERASSDKDMRHYFTTSLVWDLPIGRGHALLGDVPSLANTLLGGWQLSGIADARSGLPVNILISRATTALPDQLNKNQRPNLVPGQPLYPTNRTPQNWFNAAAFSTPANGTWGNTPRNYGRAPGLWQIDPALSKRFAIREGMALNFRAEAFNILNRAQYGTPGATVGTSSFGVITSSFNTVPTGTGTPRELQFMLKFEY